MTEVKRNFIFEDCKRSCTDTDFLILKDQSILVTGGTGFMGKWIAEMISYINEVYDLNIKVYLLGRDIQKFKIEVPHLAEKSFINLVSQDVRNIHDLPDDINYIIHAAGSPDNRDHVSQPVKTVETFYKGTNSILEAASRLSELKRIIHVSSHQVYGKNESEVYIKEDYLGRLEANSINNTYAESKRIAETLCSIYRSQLRLPVVIIRPFAFIGPYQDLEKPWAINNFIRDAILGGPIRILGNVDTIRSYLYASDMAFWILKTLVKGQVGETYNIGSSEAISLAELAKRISNSINNAIDVFSRSSKESYSYLSRLVPDTNKIITTLNVKETHTLDDSISRTILWNQLNRK